MRLVLDHDIFSMPLLKISFNPNRSYGKVCSICGSQMQRLSESEFKLIFRQLFSKNKGNLFFCAKCKNEVRHIG
jgi:hypothetical protein